MPRIFALADLHLSETGHKPMHVFGELWRDHASRMARAWDAAVAPEDTVLLAGDLSWARNLDEAAPDLAWIGSRPGRKLLLRGNHDSWWSGTSRVKRALPESCELLQNNAIRVADWVVLGARGWIAPDDPLATPEDAKVFDRELHRLKLSIEAADRLGGTQGHRIAMLHYPPWLVGREPTAVVPLLERGGVSICVFGHLHGEDHQLAPSGEREGIRYRFVAADATGFAPVEIARTVAS